MNVSNTNEHEVINFESDNSFVKTFIAFSRDLHISSIEWKNTVKPVYTINIVENKVSHVNYQSNSVMEFLITGLIAEIKQMDIFSHNLPEMLSQFITGTIAFVEGVPDTSFYLDIYFNSDEPYNGYDNYWFEFSKNGKLVSITE